MNHLIKTIADSISVSGIGLHSGQMCRVLIHPEAQRPGVYIKMMNGQSLPLEDAPAIKTPRCTRLSDREGNFVDTVEHLLAALRIVGVNSCLIEFFGTETPILNGASDQWVQKISEVGFLEVGQPAPIWNVIKPFSYTDGVCRYDAFPASDFQLEIEIDFPGTPIRYQRLMVKDSELPSLLCARTFVFEKDVKFLLETGLAQGGSLENALVIGTDGPLNAEGYRMENECVKHKALDFVGDLYRLGAPIRGRFNVFKPGHAATAGFVDAMMNASVLERMLQSSVQQAA